MLGVEPAQIERFAFEPVARDAQRQSEATFGGGFFDRVGEFAEERVGDIRHRKSDGLAAADAQTSRKTVLPVVEGDHRVVDALLRLGGQRQRAVEVTRDRRLGHVGQFGDIADRGDFGQVRFPNYLRLVFLG